MRHLEFPISIVMDFVSCFFFFAGLGVDPCLKNKFFDFQSFSSFKPKQRSLSYAVK